MAGTRKTASRTTVHHVAGAVSADPKQPHETCKPRATTDATTPMKRASITDATIDVASKSQPPMR
jgi:hypothetical protein